VAGISINGIPFAQAIASQMDLELAICRTISESEGGHLSDVFASVGGKRVVVIDDVVSSGSTMRKTVQQLRAAGADVKLCLVLANKTEMNEIDGVPLRGLVRVVTV
jgi:orotate phosphoribosyltransferase